LGQSRANQATKRTGVVMFAQPSTRTHASFVRAFQLCGMQVLDLPLNQSSMAKGESFLDTLDTLGELGYDIAVVRADIDMLQFRRYEPKIALINAGDQTSHPTQALADLGALLSRFHDIRGMLINFRGDVERSRVACSTSSLLGRLGVNYVFNYPVASNQVVYQIRQQTEQGRMWSDEEYRDTFGLVTDDITPTAIMHAGPVHVGVDISHKWLQRPECLVKQQIKYGLWTRVALIEDLNRRNNKP
jgi:aspartate carbamoyltransferase catalytic subunit